jgi:hypothetical protein
MCVKKGEERPLALRLSFGFVHSRAKEEVRLCSPQSVSVPRELLTIFLVTVLLLPLSPSDTAAVSNRHISLAQMLRKERKLLITSAKGRSS